VFKQLKTTWELVLDPSERVNFAQTSYTSPTSYSLKTTGDGEGIRTSDDLKDGALI
jgi:hypothetical protein